MTETPSTSSPQRSHYLSEIDLMGLLMRVWQEKRLLVKFVSVFGIIGVVVALTVQKEYTATVSLAPEATSMGMSQGLSDIAGMLGGKLGGNNGSVDAIYPDIYPDIFMSSDFVVQLFDVPVVTMDGKKTTYTQHLMTDVKMPFWRYPKYLLMRLIKGAPKGSVNAKVDPFALTEAQYELYEAIRSVISCQMNKSTNVITIGVTDIDPRVAATMTDTLRHRLQDYITRYRTQKARVDLEYALQLRQEAYTDYRKAEQAYSRFADGHTDAILESYKNQRTLLENQMQLKYNELSDAEQQIHQARSRIQERTPAFTVIQGASVPLKPSSMSRSMRVIFWMLLGGIADVVWVLWGRKCWKKLIR